MKLSKPISAALCNLTDTWCEFVESLPPKSMLAQLIATEAGEKCGCGRGLDFLFSVCNALVHV